MLGAYKVSHLGTLKPKQIPYNIDLLILWEGFKLRYTREDGLYTQRGRPFYGYLGDSGGHFEEACPRVQGSYLLPCESLRRAPIAYSLRQIPMSPRFPRASDG